jgi:hypothetical protein
MRRREVPTLPKISPFPGISLWFPCKTEADRKGVQTNECEPAPAKGREAGRREERDAVPVISSPSALDDSQYESLSCLSATRYIAPSRLASLDRCNLRMY